MKISFVASSAPLAQKALEQLGALYPDACAPEEADIIVPLGGDGHVLKTLQSFEGRNKRFYAMRRTESVGFLCNAYHPENLPERLERAQNVVLRPLRVECLCEDGSHQQASAINEITFMRLSPQSAKLRVTVDGTERIHCFSGDGLLISTPAGSTAYNHSAGGPIMPLDSNTLVMTAICGYLPRSWSYAVLPQSSVVDIKVLETHKRPVRVEAGTSFIDHVISARVWLDNLTAYTLLFDPDQHLGERIVREQFML